MGFQSGINATLGTVAGAVLGVKKGLAERQKQANTKAAEVKKAKTEQKTRRRNFMRDYLAKQETSLGGTVGELPPAMQKQIASQYSKSQRRAMMDRMDREAKDGK